MSKAGSAEERIENSRNAFESVVWPEIMDWFVDDEEDAQLLPTEGEGGLLSTKFDTAGGVDYWVVESPARMFSIASRVQPQYEFPTFTVRYKLSTGNNTEHQKRVLQYRDNQAHLPTWTVQAYVEPTLGVLQNAACVSTADLYKYIINRRCPISEDELMSSDGDEWFYPVWWSKLLGCTDIKIYNESRVDMTEQHQQSLDSF